MSDLPYQAERAKSGKASCKGCKKKIDKGTLRLAAMVQSAIFDGKQANWYHDDCFFKKQRPQSINDIAYFNKLENADQKKIKEMFESSGTSEAVEMPVGNKKGKGKKRHSTDTPDGNQSQFKDFIVERSKSSRAMCRHCEIKICKDEVRVCKTVYDTEVGKKYGGQALWHHLKCFAEKRNELLYFAGGESLPGFEQLTKEDQDIVKNEIRPLKSDEVPVKKIKAEPKDEADLKEEQERQKKIEEQNIVFQKYRTALNKLKMYDMERLLQHNSQNVPRGKPELMDRLADCLAFGALEPCPECKEGQLVLDTLGYKCTGNISQWTKCVHITQEVKRTPMKILEEFETYPVFNGYIPKVGVRVFHAAPPPAVFVKEEPSTSAKKDIPIPPLKNLQFFLYGRLKNKEETKRRILKLGGLVVSKLTDTMVAVVSTKKEVERMPDKMKEIKDKHIEVVEENFLDSIDNEKGTIAASLQIIKDNNIAEWGSDPATRVPQDVLGGKSIPKSGSIHKPTNNTINLKICGGTAVDPASKLENVAHVYVDERGVKYTVVLVKTDVVAHTNSFYKLQVLEENDETMWLFRSWGRIGTKIGGSAVDPGRGAWETCCSFEHYYHQKTGNHWGKPCVKVPGLYYPIEVDYGSDEVEVIKTDPNSKLAEPVQLLVTKIFDTDTMKNMLKEFELDTEKMPLGKLSKNQIMSGYEVLSELLKLIEDNKASQSKIMDATNRFFTLIPHNFGDNDAPLLDNAEIIKRKTEMLDNMLEIEIAYNLLKSENNKTTIPIDAHYAKLKSDIAPLDEASDEYLMIAEYVNNTHASTHSSYTLDIEKVFKVVRDGEDERFKPFKSLHNRRLLWHGSRVTNFAGILSQGLRIAPPEAPSTGYMFGKGVYFADMVSKSANYCCTNYARPVGFLLLCEVALGDMKICHQSEDVKLPPGTHSAWGVGRTEPDPAQSRVLPDGLVVPLGKPVKKPDTLSLLYNEFIVYDVAQVNVKYLIEMKFNFSY